MQTRIFRALNATLNPNTVPECEKYERLSDDFWECLARHYTQTIYHPSGTTKMGPRNDSMAVVDAQLQVYGIKNLRVVDCSIMPTITTGNTNVPVMMIAEKAADMIKAKHLSNQSSQRNSFNYVPDHRNMDYYNQQDNFNKFRSDYDENQIYHDQNIDDLDVHENNYRRSVNGYNSHANNVERRKK